ELARQRGKTDRNLGEQARRLRKVVATRREIEEGERNDVPERKLVRVRAPGRTRGFEQRPGFSIVPFPPCDPTTARRGGGDVGREARPFRRREGDACCSLRRGDVARAEGRRRVGGPNRGGPGSLRRGLPGPRSPPEARERGAAARLRGAQQGDAEGEVCERGALCRERL